MAKDPLLQANQDLTKAVVSLTKAVADLARKQAELARVTLATNDTMVALGKLIKDKDVDGGGV